MDPTARYLPPNPILDTSEGQPLVRRHKKKWYKKWPFVFFFLILVGAVITVVPSLFSQSDANSLKTIAKQAAKAASTDAPVQQTYFWRPDIASISANPVLTKPELSAKSAMAMDLDTGKVYFVKNPEKRLPMASITKVMTALLTKEKAKGTDLFTVSDYAANVGENAMGVLPSEQYTVNELLWGLFLHSGNDAAETLAEGVSGHRNNFIALMNTRAKELGMFNTHYINPSGMEDGQGMRTTAVDLAILSKYTLDKYPELLDITKTIEKTLPATDYHRAISLVGEIDLIRTYPGAVGFKTGFTDEAGRCIITVAENHGKRLMVIVLGSQDRRVDAVKLLDYAYANEGIKITHEPYW